MEKSLIYHCRKCNYTKRITVEYDLVVFDVAAHDKVYIKYPLTQVATQHIDCPNCVYDFGALTGMHRTISANAIEGKYNPDHECNDECLTAINAKCSCACGGANHGIKYEASQPA